MGSREEILEKARAVPALPAAAARVITLIQDPDVGISELMKVIEHDPGLTSNVLRLANSAYFGGNREIVSVRDAGVRLGMNRIFQLVLTSAITPTIAEPVRGYSLPPGELLEHSIAVAVGSEELARKVGKKVPPHTFTTGLLHDIGKTVLGLFVEVDADPILDVAFEEKVSFEIAERRVLGIDHAEVGAVLLDEWNLPENIVDGVRHHHSPLDCEDDPFVASVVHVVDNLCLERGIGMGIDGLNYWPSPEVIERLHLTAELSEEVAHDVLERLEELRGIFGTKTAA